MRIGFSFIILLFVATACSNNRTSIPELKFDGLKGNVSGCKDYRYDAEERFGEIIPGDLDVVFIYEYDNDGHQIKLGIYDDDGDYIFKQEKVFEKALVVSSTTMTRVNDKKKKNTVVERNKNYIKWRADDGSTMETFYDNNSSLTKDENGDIIEESVFDNKGRPLEVKAYYKGELSYRQINEYDKSGLLIRTKTYYSSNNSEVLTYKYPEFDKKGNWIVQYVYENEEIEYIVKRDITYR